MMASDKGHVAVVKLLLEAGADKEAKDKVHAHTCI
jgi:ankyrin repeat protein